MIFLSSPLVSPIPGSKDDSSHRFKGNTQTKSLHNGFETMDGDLPTKLRAWERPLGLKPATPGA